VIAAARRARACRATAIALAATLALGAPARGAPGSTAAPRTAWPAGTQVLKFENLEGLMLFTATMRGTGGRDTTGLVALDTGAGFLALDLGLARALGIVDTSSSKTAIDESDQPLPRFTLGSFAVDAVAPVLTIDAEVIRRVTDRPVLGLLGQRPLDSSVIWIDYARNQAAFIPGVEASEGAQGSRESDARRAEQARLSRRDLAGVLSARAVALGFRLVGDGKVLVRARVSNPRPPEFSEWLNLIVDTGATKSVLFTGALELAAPNASEWPALRGLSAPTLVGDAAARLARIPMLEVAGPAELDPAEPVPGVKNASGSVRVSARGVDFGILRSPLEEMLSRVAQVPIQGVLGYSFLKRFRVAFDYPRRVLWLDPISDYREDRPFEYSHVGLQIERREHDVVIAGVAADSPADRAGILRGDVLDSVDGASAGTLDLVALTRRMEGRPGTAIQLIVRRDGKPIVYRLVRRRLL
jgi:hypothetical protein